MRAASIHFHTARRAPEQSPRWPSAARVLSESSFQSSARRGAFPELPGGPIACVPRLPSLGGKQTTGRYSPSSLSARHGSRHLRLSLGVRAEIPGGGSEERARRLSIISAAEACLQASGPSYVCLSSSVDLHNARSDPRPNQ